MSSTLFWCLYLVPALVAFVGAMLVNYGVGAREARPFYIAAMIPLVNLFLMFITGISLWRAITAYKKDGAK